MLLFSNAGAFLIGFGAAWAVGLIVTFVEYRRAGGRHAETDEILIPLLTPALIVGLGVILTQWS